MTNVQYAVYASSKLMYIDKVETFLHKFMVVLPVRLDKLKFFVPLFPSLAFVMPIFDAGRSRRLYNLFTFKLSVPGSRV